MDDYDVVAEAEQLIEDNLSALQAETETRKFRINAKSGLACRCPSCRAETFVTLVWLKQIRSSSSKQPAAE